MGGQRFIGLLGGTFDPVHYGHLQPARAAKQRLGFDELRLIPCKLPAHREQPLANAEQRLHMLQLALQEFPELSLDARELSRDGPSFSVDTLTSLRAEQPQAIFCWILGLDAFLEFHLWRRWRRVMELAHLLVVRRPGYSVELPVETADLLNRHRVETAAAMRDSQAGAILLLELDAPDISATRIRRMLAGSESVEGLLPAAVCEWLTSHPVYLTQQP